MIMGCDAPAAMKRCTKCRRLKPVDRFCPTPTHRSGRESWCRLCKNERLRLGRLDPATRERYLARDRCRARTPGRRGARYGLTAEQFVELVGDGMCQAGCGRVGTDVDHDHGCCPSKNRACGRCVRGWLCHPCNTAEGYLRTPEAARGLADYMERIALRTEA